ncbi:MAG TPA: hypothetical protein VEL47_04275 [Myxococcota bacterium]|nr:hypothetical protein [Myxococcota bacterium]
MSQNSNRNFRGRNAVSFNKGLTEMPENLGNRRTYEEIRIPPDNVGNVVENDPIGSFIHDGLGNSLDEEPAHLKSGILSNLSGNKDRSFISKNMRNGRSTAEVPSPSHTVGRNNQNHPRALRPRSNDALRNHQVENKVRSSGDADDYMAILAKEFVKLFREKSGLPFSFSMKPISDASFDEVTEKTDLLAMQNLIDRILRSCSITATVELTQYGTSQHRFAVFLINPSDRNPSKNKELISALRQVVNLHATKFPPRQTNVLLVLANAKNIIEDHLAKIGAKKL